MTSDSPAHTAAPAGAKTKAVIGQASPDKKPVKNNITPADGGRYVIPFLFSSGMPMENGNGIYLESSISRWYSSNFWNVIVFVAT